MRLRGIIAVDLFGLPCDLERLEAIATRKHLFVIEDAAQSLGAEWKGRRAGSFGHAAATSFFPAKPLGGYGDGGMCFTNDETLASTLRSIRVHGQGEDAYRHIRLGLNGRLDSIQAAVLLAKLTCFEEEIVMRNKVARTYMHYIERKDLHLRWQEVPPGTVSVWAQFSVLSDSQSARDRFRCLLGDARIPTAVYYPLPLHLQPVFSNLGYQRGDFPVSESLARRIFSLPMHPYLEADQIERIVTVMAR